MTFAEWLIVLTVGVTIVLFVVAGFVALSIFLESWVGDVIAMLVPLAILIVLVAGVATWVYT